MSLTNDLANNPPFDAVADEWLCKKLGNGVYHIVFAMPEDLEGSGDVDAADTPEGTLD